jgi:hypothetical protein
VHSQAHRARHTMLATAVPVGLVLSAALTWTSTYAAFSASTGNTGNSWQTGSVVLADGDSGAALFDTTSDSALKPGSTGSRCIRVDYTGSLVADLRLYVTTPATGASSLDPFLVMSVERGVDVTAATPVAANCSTGFTSAATPAFLYNTRPANDLLANDARTLADLKTRHADHASGLVVDPATAPGSSLTFKITYSVKDDNAAQNSQSSATFTWEARST